MKIPDSVSIITGAARGIGYSLAQLLVQQGGRVLLADVDETKLEEAKTSLGSDYVLTRVTDVRSPGQLRDAVEMACSTWGHLDVWVNNAGLARHKAITDYTEAEVTLMLDVNMKGTIFGSQAALRHMTAAGRGHIVNVISTASLRGIPSESVYCATKWGVRGFTQALQEEAARYGVRVTAVLPGGVNTAFWEQAVDGPMPVEDFLTPGHVARAIIAALEQDDFSVIRELVVRSIQDRDFAGR